MKYLVLLASVASSSFFLSSCGVTPQQGQTAAGGVYQDPNNPYAVPGVTTQGAYAPTAPTTYQAPAVTSAPYQSIPSAPINPPATIPSYTAPVTTTPAVSSSGGSHTVAAGDSLWGLSRKYGVSVDQLRSANNLSGDLIVTGSTLTIPN